MLAILLGSTRRASGCCVTSHGWRVRDVTRWRARGATLLPTCDSLCHYLDKVVQSLDRWHRWRDRASDIRCRRLGRRRCCWRSLTMLCFTRYSVCRYVRCGGWQTIICRCHRWSSVYNNLCMNYEACSHIPDTTGSFHSKWAKWLKLFWMTISPSPTWVKF